MGGVLLKEALYQIYDQHNTVGNGLNPPGVFPDSLSLDHVVTIASPLGGVPAPAGNFDCGNCTEITEISFHITQNPSIYSDLINGENVSNDVLHTWTMEGESSTDGNTPCDPVGDSAFQMNSGIKFDYDTGVPGVAEMQDACNPLTGDPYYGHGTYLQDNQPANNVTVNYCDGCAGDPGTQITNFRHSLNAMAAGIVTNYPVVNVPNGGAFLDKWKQMSDVLGVLGAPTGTWYSVTGGQGQNFQHGSIYWSSATGTYEVQNGIYNEYTSVLHCPNCVQGFPTSDELQVKNGSGTVIGAVSYFYGNLCGARGPNNSGSAVYSSSSGTFMVGGCIYQRYWRDFGGPGGNSSYDLGYPVSDVLVISGGYVSYFGGQGCSGALGPYNSGTAIFSSASGTYEVQGCIYGEYEHAGGPGYLGFPLTDEQGAAGGRVSYFSGQNCGSAVYYTSSTLAHEVQGCIYQAYINFGGPSSALGFPVSDEHPNASGQRESDFQGGYIIWANNQPYILLNMPGCRPVGASC